MELVEYASLDEFLLEFQWIAHNYFPKYFLYYHFEYLTFIRIPSFGHREIIPNTGRPKLYHMMTDMNFNKYFRCMFKKFKVKKRNKNNQKSVLNWNKEVYLIMFNEHQKFIRKNLILSRKTRSVKSELTLCRTIENAFKTHNIIQILI